MSNDILAVRARRLRSYARAISSQKAVDAGHNAYKKANDGFLYVGAADEASKAHNLVVRAENNAFKAGASSADLYNATA